MSYGEAHGLKVKLFSDYEDGNVEEKLNKFFEENYSITVVDIKFQITNLTDNSMYGSETALLIYRDI